MIVRVAGFAGDTLGGKTLVFMTFGTGEWRMFA